MLLMLGKQEYDIFTVFRLKILWYRCLRGKFFDKILKNSRPILVATLQLKGGLNHVIFLRLGLFLLKFGGVCFNFSSYPLDFRAFSYIVFSLSNVFLSLERPLILFPIISGMFLVIDFGWLESQCMYCGWSFSFLNGLYDPAFRFKCTSRKSTSGKLMIVVIWRFSSLKHLIRSLRILSSFGPFAFGITAKPSSLYKPMYDIGIILWIFDSKYSPTISHTSRKALLFNNSECWVKKSGKLFDVTMGAYDGAEVCEIVGLYLLSKIHKIIPISYIGLYRDDGLAVIPNANGPKLDRIRKDLIKCFKEENLQITTIINLPEVDFLDVHLNLKAGSYKPFRKENDQPQYIHCDSNHPKSITKNIPEMIGKRISGLSSDKKTFEREKTMYENALKSSGYDEKLKHTPPNFNKKRPRRRKITWFNPPFSCNVATNIGREFLRILSKNFPLKHRYHKIFNRNTVKISYSCLPNMSSIIKSHNNKVLATSQKINVAESDASTCNCRKSAACPLEGKCLTKSIIYQATISSNNKNSQKFRYIGLTEGTFKSRYNGHLQSIRHEKHETATELSKKYWEIKRGGNEPYIAWKIVKQVDTYKGGQPICNLCLAEKYFIIRDRGRNLLNSRTEILSKCRHRKKFLLNRAI